MASVRIYVKQQLRLDRLNFNQMQMFKLGNVGVAAVKNRLAAARGPTDGPAKPLSRLYAIRKSRQGYGNKRNLRRTGQMLGNFGVRTVSDKRAVASVSGLVYRDDEGRSFQAKTVEYRRKGAMKFRRPNTRDVAWYNHQREPWMVFSPRDAQKVHYAAGMMVKEMAPRLILQRWLNS